MISCHRTDVALAAGFFPCKLCVLKNEAKMFKRRLSGACRVSVV